MADTPENPGASPEEAGQHISVEEESGENGDMEKQSILKGDEGKVLVVYYSWSENTKRIALRLAHSIGADSCEIRTVNAYPTDGYETSDISEEERRTGKLPEIKDDLPVLEEYDTIIVGGPIWNAHISTPLARYLELTDFSGKTVIPFSTSMGSGQDSYLKDFKESVQNAGKI